MISEMDGDQQAQVFTQRSRSGVILREGLLPISSYKFQQWERTANATHLHDRIRQEGMSFSEIDR
jgi:hypothetical protein